MLALHRISRLRQPRSNRASTALLIITFGIFAVLGHLAVERKQNDAQWTQEAPDATEELDAWSPVHHLRF